MLKKILITLLVVTISLFQVGVFAKQGPESSGEQEKVNVQEQIENVEDTVNEAENSDGSVDENTDGSEDVQESDNAESSEGEDSEEDLENEDDVQDSDELENEEDELDSEEEEDSEKPEDEENTEEPEDEENTEDSEDEEGNQEEDQDVDDGEEEDDSKQDSKNKNNEKVKKAIKEALKEAKKEREEAKKEAKEYIKDLKDLFKDADRETKKQILGEIAQVKRELKDYSIGIFMKGIHVDFDKYDGVKPIIKDDRTLVPLRAVVETLGANVLWEGETGTITITKDDISIVMHLESKVAIVNGEEIQLDVAPATINDRTLMPIRFIAETFQLNVDWDEDSQMVVVED